jgi:predicted nucleic acid-binding protein
MKQYFADTFYFLALLNPRDEYHSAAQTALSSTAAKLISTRWVLIEVADALASISMRSRCVSLFETLEADEQVEIISASDEWFRRGMELYRQRPDKDWPLTDCISFAVMGDLGVKEALTGDRHFRQAGFVPLLSRGDS